MPEARLARARKSLPPDYVYEPPRLITGPARRAPKKISLFLDGESVAEAMTEALLDGDERRYVVLSTLRLLASPTPVIHPIDIHRADADMDPEGYGLV